MLNGLAGASSLFLVAAGLSLIFGVTRIVNFAHGSFYMLGLYLAYTLVERLSRQHRLLARAAAGAPGHRRAGRGGRDGCCCAASTALPELLQLLATFALVLVVKDAVLWAWGPEELFGPRAPGLEGSVDILGGRSPRTTCC